jgi:hypothetical protein
MPIVATTPRPPGPGRALFPGGRRGTTIATMKKLLLLVVIAALATIATKKVRAA